MHQIRSDNEHDLDNDMNHHDYIAEHTDARQQGRRPLDARRRGRRLSGALRP